MLLKALHVLTETGVVKGRLVRIHVQKPLVEKIVAKVRRKTAAVAHAVQAHQNPRHQQELCWEMGDGARKGGVSWRGPTCQNFQKRNDTP